MWVRKYILSSVISVSFEQRDQTHGVDVHVSDYSALEMLKSKKPDFGDKQRQDNSQMVSNFKCNFHDRMI